MLVDVDAEAETGCSACDESERQPGVPADRSSCKDDEREGDAAPDERFFEFVFCVHTSSVVDGDQIKYLIFIKIQVFLMRCVFYDAWYNEGIWESIWSH